MKRFLKLSLCLLPLWPALLSATITSRITYSLGEAGSLGTRNLPLDAGGNSRHFTTATGGTNSLVRTAGVWAPGSTAYLSTTATTAEGWSAPDLLNGLATDNFAFGVFVRAPAVENGGRDIMTLGSSNGALKLSLGAGGWCASAHNVSWIGPAEGVAGSFASSKWVHLGVIRRGGVSTFYLNGVARGSWNGQPVHGTPHLCLSINDGLNFHGHIDQARIVTFDGASGDTAVLTELWGASTLPGDLATNPGFETGMAGWAAFFCGTVQADTNAPHSGSLSAYATARPSTDQGLTISALASAVPGKSHVGSAWVRTSSVTPVLVNMFVQQDDGAGTAYNSVASSAQVTNAWTKISGVFNYDVNGTATGLQLNINGPPAGVDLWVDDISFAPVDTTAVENLLINSGFENGTTGWTAHGTSSIAASALAHTNTGAAVVTNRSDTWQGIEQSLLGKTEEGQMYYTAGWVTTNQAGPSTVILTLEVNDASGARYFQVANGTASNASWTWLSGTVTMPVTNGLTGVKIFLEGPPSGVEMRVDDCYFAPVTGLRRAAAAFPALRLGGVGGVANWANDPRFRAAISAHFHLSSPENSMKFDSTQPADGTWRFAESKAMNELGIARGGSSRGHVMVWHSQIAGWVPNTASQVATRTTLWNYIDKIGSVFKGRLACWDVVNEAINDSNGGLRPSLWYNSPGIGYAADGDKYIRESFIRARASDPATPLYYNDYNTETINTKSNAIYNMLSGFVASGVPVTGVGFQSHLFNSAPDGPSTRANFQRLQDLGLDLQITELDINLAVDGSGRASAGDLEMQGDSYFNYLGTALGYSRLKVFQTWGVYDGASWIPSFFSGRGQALPLDFDYNRKPAYWGMWNAMAGQCEKLDVLAVSNGDDHAVLENTTLSANAGRQLNSNATGDSITLQAHVPFSGQWNVKIGALKQATGGSFQLAIAPPGSTTFTGVSNSKDTYAGSSTATELNLGTATFATTGDWQFRFTVTGKNPSATDYQLLLDYIRLTPLSCAPAVSRIVDQSIPMNSILSPRLFLAEDDFAEGTLQVTATSSNPTLLPTSAITLNGASPYYTVAATPTTDQIGTTTISVTASDGTTTSSRNFTLTVAGTPLQTWRQLHFSTTTNTGIGADSSDANSDGESNFMEFATAQNPRIPSRATPTLVRNGGNLEFTYVRSTAALADAVAFLVEWSDDLTPGSWSTTGVSQAVLSDNGTTQNVRSSVPASASGKRFLRLRVVK
jgi:GH35 family endo-1,4-beta-xylanase